MENMRLCDGEGVYDVFFWVVIVCTVVFHFR